MYISLWQNLIKKIFCVTKLLKKVVERSLNEADDIMKQDDLTEEKIQMLYQETLMHEINAVRR